jgi:hypothetical protein
MSCKCLLQLKNWIARLVAKHHFFIMYEEWNRFSNQYIDYLWLKFVKSGMYRCAFIVASIGNYGAFFVDGFEHKQVSSTECLKCNVESICTKYLICVFIFLSLLVCNLSHPTACNGCLFTNSWKWVPYENGFNHGRGSKKKCLTKKGL